MAGLAGLGQGGMQSALSGLARSSSLEEARKNTGMQMKQAYKSQVIGGTMSGVASGAMIGATVGGPWGALVGGIIGGVVGYGASSSAG